MPADTQIYTPYGATESLPVAVIGSDEILNETSRQTSLGAGTCVGRPVNGIDVRIIHISDDPISSWDESLCLPPGEIGEIVVDGPMVTQSYFNRPELTALAKIFDPQKQRMRHRMGDVGYFDSHGRLWFCGRKSHRVVTATQTLFTDPIEGIFNTHPAVFRSALVGVSLAGVMTPIVCIEREKNVDLEKSKRINDEYLAAQLFEIGQQHAQTRLIKRFLFHPNFPVDIRHNSKIFREKLARWANLKLG